MAQLSQRVSSTATTAAAPNVPLNAAGQPLFTVIDWPASSQVCHNDSQFVKDLLGTLYDDVFFKTIPTLQEAWEQHDWKGLRAEIHRCKAIFPYINKVSKLQRVMTELQTLLREDSPSLQQVDTLFAQVREQLRRVLAETRVFLKQPEQR